MTLRWHVPLSLLLILGGPALGIAEGEMTRWFSCGIGFWRPCVPEPESVPQAPLTSSSSPVSETIAPEALRNWGTPVIGSSGALSYQLPPRPLLDLFQEPTDANARAYLTWLSNKAHHREAAFAAIKRMAADVGYSVRQMPTGNVGENIPTEVLAGQMPTDRGPGLPLQAGAVTDPPVSLPPSSRQTVGEARRVTPPASASISATKSLVLGPRTRVLYFFAPHCPYCAQETPLLSELLQGRSDVVGIAMDTTREALLTYLRTARLTFPVTLDQGESQAFGITGYPAVVVRDETGAARKLTGLATKEQLQQVLTGVMP
jgi:thiol-disulfide isomerase/thioredoxin